MTADHASARLDVSAQEPRESAVRQDLAVGLAGRAVDDLVRLVAHAAKIGAAHRTGLTRSTVHGEVLAEFGRANPPSASARAPSASASTPWIAVHQSAAFVVIELAERGVRRELRAVQDVVGVPATDPRHRSLVPQDRVHMTRVLARQEEGLCVGAIGLRSQLAREARRRRARAPTIRPCVRGPIPSRASTGGRSPGCRTTAPRGFVRFGGASTSTRPPCDRWTSTRSPPSSSNTRYLPRRDTRSIRWPTASAGRGANVFSEENCSGSRASRTPPASHLVEPLRERLHLRHLRHRLDHPARSAAALRTMSMHSSMRSPCVRWDTMHARSR